MKKLIRLGLFCSLAAVCPAIVEAQSLSFFRTLPGEVYPTSEGFDASGLYVASDFTHIRKYDYEGALLWYRAYDRTITLFASGGAGVYSAGFTSKVGGLYTSYVNLFDAEGNEVWNRTFTSPISPTISYDLVADGSGVYLLSAPLGSSGSEGLQTRSIRKFDDRGTELWRVEVPNFLAYRLAADSSGVYAHSGTSFRKYSPAGAELWRKTVNIGELEMEANASGVFVSGLDTSSRLFLARYDSSGNELWIRYGHFGKIALDANSVYTVGPTQQEPGECASGLQDLVATRYDLDGKILWTRQFGTHQWDTPGFVTAGPSGVFVTGSSTLSTGFDTAFLAKLEPESASVSTSEPRIRNECVVNAASFVGGAVSPGEIVAIFGANLGPAQPVSAPGDRTFGTILADTRVLFDGIPAPLLYVSSEQVNLVVPNAVASKSSVQIQVEYRGVLSKAVTLPVLPAHLGIFNIGDRQAAVVHLDGTVNSPSNPARLGSVVSIFATGGGLTNPATLDGEIVGQVLHFLKTPLKVAFYADEYTNEGVEPVAPSYAGAVPSVVAGLVQVNVKLPDTWAFYGNYMFPVLTVGASELESPPSVRIWITRN